MKKFRISYLALAALLSTSLLALAQENFMATLTPGQEVSAPTFTEGPGANMGAARPMSFGDATLTLSADLSQLTMTINVFNIDVTGSQTAFPNDNLGAAHIHGPAMPGVNASVVWGFFGTPFHNTDMDLVLTPFGVGQVGGTFTVTWDAGEGTGTGLAGHINNIRNGLMYLNFHTTENGGGEIRGQIVVPEPSTFALLGAGVVGLAAAAWRRRRKA